MSDTVVAREVLVWSEGSRLKADLFSPPGGLDQTPAILLCHGWGGMKSHLAKYAERFAAAGFAALVFDYRGWGESDGKIIPQDTAPMLTTAGPAMLPVRVVREIVDPVDHVADVRACFSWLLSEPGIDAGRVGLWGTSYGGGHVTFVAGTDPRVRAVVAQIGGFGPPVADWYRDLAYKRQADKARANIDPPLPQGIDAPEGLKGTPDVARQWGHLPLEKAKNIRVPMLILDAEFEELNNRLEHGKAAHDIVKENAPSEYITYPCRHYVVYEEYFEDAVQRATQWYKTYL
jgi:dienelactone hydrolase